MSDIHWEAIASLVRVTELDTAEPLEELVERDTLFDLVGRFLDMPASGQDALMIRVETDDTQEYDADAIRELAARPEFTGGRGEWDAPDSDREAYSPAPDPGVD